MTRGELVANEAREWLGTKFHWQASAKQVGCDCKGLIWGVARELHFPEAETFYAKVVDYRVDRKVPTELLKEGMASVFEQAIDMQVGDVLLLQVKGKPQHLAIVTPNNRAIHAQIAPKDWVKETSLRALLKLNPLDSIWRWRDGN